MHVVEFLGCFSSSLQKAQAESQIAEMKQKCQHQQEEVQCAHSTYICTTYSIQCCSIVQANLGCDETSVTMNNAPLMMMLMLHTYCFRLRD